MKKLGLAEGDTELAKERYGEGVEWCSDDPPVPGKYDVVVLYNWLQQAEQPQVLKLLRYYTNLLKDGGQLVVVVPSLDWACGEIAYESNPSIATFVGIFGTPSQPHRCGFTMNWLRLVLTQTEGLILNFASTEGVILSNGDQQMDAQQNVAICTKYAKAAEDAIP